MNSKGSLTRALDTKISLGLMLPSRTRFGVSVFTWFKPRPPRNKKRFCSEPLSESSAYSNP